MIQDRISPDPDWIVGKHALMNVRCHMVDGKTIIQPGTWRIPFQWQGYHYQDHDDQPFMLMLNSGGGYVEGDGSTFSAKIEPNARALFTTTASAKFYKCLNGLTTNEIVEFDVGDNALLEYLPDEAIPFEASRTRRSIRIAFKDSSRLFATDMVSAGRVHYGREIFKFHALRSSFELIREGKTIALDKVVINSPAEAADLDRLWKGARHSVLVFGYAPDLSVGIEDLIASIYADVEGTQIGVSRIGNLITVRILAMETWQAHEAIFNCWTALRPSIAGKQARPILKC